MQLFYIFLCIYHVSHEIQTTFLLLQRLFYTSMVNFVFRLLYFVFCILSLSCVFVFVLCLCLCLVSLSVSCVFVLPLVPVLCHPIPRYVEKKTKDCKLVQRDHLLLSTICDSFLGPALGNNIIHETVWHFVFFGNLRPIVSFWIARPPSL